MTNRLSVFVKEIYEVTDTKFIDEPCVTSQTTIERRKCTILCFLRNPNWKRLSFRTFALTTLKRNTSSLYITFSNRSLDSGRVVIYTVGTSINLLRLRVPPEVSEESYVTIYLLKSIPKQEQE